MGTCGKDSERKVTQFGEGGSRPTAKHLRQGEIPQCEEMVGVGVSGQGRAAAGVDIQGPFLFLGGCLRRQWFPVDHCLLLSSLNSYVPREETFSGDLISVVLGGSVCERLHLSLGHQLFEGCGV